MRPDTLPFYPYDTLSCASQASQPTGEKSVQTFNASGIHPHTTDSTHGGIPSSAGELESLRKWVDGSQAVTADTRSLFEFMEWKAKWEADILNALVQGSCLPPEQKQQSFSDLNSLATSLNIEISNLLQSVINERQVAEDHMSELSEIISKQKQVISEQRGILAEKNESEGAVIGAVSTGSRQSKLSLSQINVHYMTDEAEVRASIAPAELEDTILGGPVASLSADPLRRIQSPSIAAEAQSQPARPESSPSVYSALPDIAVGNSDTKSETLTMFSPAKPKPVRPANYGDCSLGKRYNRINTRKGSAYWDTRPPPGGPGVDQENSQKDVQWT
jgi:hypothetical protein